MKYNIPFIKPAFPASKEVIEDYKQILASNWYTNFGPYEKKFAGALENFIGQDVHVATISNATLGLMSAIQALLGKGDGSKYVLMPSFTFIAGAQAVLWCGYKPYFVDIQEDTLQMNINQTKSILKENEGKISGILFCNAFGVGDPNISSWEDFAKQNSLPLIIDSAAGFGSKYQDGNYLGARGDCEVFSFHATKPFAIGEGGAVASRDPELIEKINSIQNFGFDQNRDGHYLGFNGKLQEINAAIGLRQLINFPERIKSRQRSLFYYQDGLKHLFDPQVNSERSALCFATVVCRDSESRNMFAEALEVGGVEARRYYSPPIHQHDYFTQNRTQWASAPLPVTESVSSRVLSLPIHDNMKSVVLEHIVGLIKAAK